MSHNIRLSNVRFTNLDILKAAVAELQSEGSKIELVEGTGLMARQVGNIPCDLLLKVDGGPWDVGFVREGDAYIPQIESDFREERISAAYGAKPVDGCRVDYGHIAVGGLAQRYAVIQAEINAAQAGYSSTRETDPATRQMVLTVGG